MNNSYTYELLEKKLNTKAGRKQIQKDIKKVIEHFEKELLPDYEQLTQTENFKCYKASYFDVKDYLEENYKEYATELLDKLENNYQYGCFYDFCEREYEYYEEWKKMNGLEHVKHYHYGRTSSFYLIDEEEYYILTNKWSGFNDTVADTTTIIDNYYEYQTGYEENKTNDILSDYFINEYDPEENTPDCIDFVYFILCEFKEDFKKHFEDVLEVKKYINSFFENEEESYKSYLEGEIEFWLYEEVIPEKKQEEYQDTLDNIADNYINDPVYIAKAYASYIQFKDTEKLESSEVKNITRRILEDIDFLKHDKIISDEEYKHLKSLTE